MCTYSQCAVLTRLLSSLQFYKSTQRRIKNFIRDSTGSKSGFGSKPPVATSTHVPSRAMCPRCLSTNSDLLLHAPYCEYRLTTRSAHVATHVISHNDPAKSESQPHRP